jgi:hypothetical protein
VQKIMHECVDGHHRLAGLEPDGPLAHAPLSAGRIAPWSGPCQTRRKRFEGDRSGLPAWLPADRRQMSQPRFLTGRRSSQ